jgi:hypothetical protein
MPMLSTLVLTLILQAATVIDVQPHQQTGIILQSGQTGIPLNHEMFILAVRIDDMIYSADFYSSRHLKSTDFTVGDHVQAAVENDKLTVQRKDGKTATAKIVRKQRVVIEPKKNEAN